MEREAVRCFRPPEVDVLKKLPRVSKVFNARIPRKTFPAAYIKVGLEVKRSQDLSLSAHRVAMKISGHLTESTFEGYNIVDSIDRHEEIAKVEKHFDGKLSGWQQREIISPFISIRAEVAQW